MRITLALRLPSYFDHSPSGEGGFEPPLAAWNRSNAIQRHLFDNERGNISTISCTISAYALGHPPCDGEGFQPPWEIFVDLESKYYCATTPVHKILKHKQQR